MGLNLGFDLRQVIQRRLLNRRSLKDGGILLLANAFVVGLGLIRTPAITWIIPKEQVGIIGVVASWLPFVRILTYPGLDLASYHYMSKGQYWAFVINLRYRLKWSFFGSLVLLAGALYWYSLGEETLFWIFVITAIFFPATDGLTSTSGALSAQERYKDLFWYRIFESLTDFTGFIPLLLSTWWLNQAITFYGFNQLATTVMLVIYSVWIYRRLRSANPPSLSADDEREMLRYGKHQTALASIGIVQTRADALLVGMFLPLTTMADYTIALLIYEQFKRLWNIYIAVRYPPLVRMTAFSRQRRFILEGGLVSLGFALTGVLVSAVAHLLIPIILPSEYVSSLDYIDILIAAAVIIIPGGFAEMYFRTQQKEKQQYHMRIISAIVGAIAPALMMLKWGAYGAAFGRLIAGLILSIVGLTLFAIEVNSTKLPS